MLILFCLYLLGRAEEALNLKLAVHSYEVTGGSSDEIIHEVNRILEPIHAIMQNVQVAATRDHIRLQFDLEGTRKDQVKVLEILRHSTVLKNVSPLGPVSA
jgi:hypothetical protein